MSTKPNVKSKWFRRLNHARNGKGHSVEMACALLKISAATWAKWSAGSVKRPLPAVVERIDEYCNDGAKKK